MAVAVPPIPADEHARVSALRALRLLDQDADPAYQELAAELLNVPIAAVNLMRFFRASTATDQHIPGVGLGLTIVRAIAEGHDGSVEVRSVEGEGTTFALELPA
jgi:light-regulated signal transduction histidine kinase (bacteriophytochrome)